MQTCLISKVEDSKLLFLCKVSCKNYLQGSQSLTSTLSPEATTQQVMLVRNRIFYSLHTRSMVVKWDKFCFTKVVSFLLRGDEEIEGSVTEREGLR